MFFSFVVVLDRRKGFLQFHLFFPLGDPGSPVLRGDEVAGVVNYLVPVYAVRKSRPGLDDAVLFSGASPRWPSRESQSHSLRLRV